MEIAIKWVVALGAASLVGWWLRRVGTQEAVSSAWVREQIRERGVRGWTGAYHEDE